MKRRGFLAGLAAVIAAPAVLPAKPDQTAALCKSLDKLIITMRTVPVQPLAATEWVVTNTCVLDGNSISDAIATAIQRGDLQPKTLAGVR